jgi:hypothetical protein
VLINGKGMHTAIRMNTLSVSCFASYVLLNLYTINQINKKSRGKIENTKYNVVKRRGEKGSGNVTGNEDNELPQQLRVLRMRVMRTKIEKR